jgi:hypothetical protein
LIAYSSVLGEQRPRISRLPVYKASVGPKAVALADMAGLELDDWQQWCLINGLGKRENGSLSAFEICIILARQNGKTALIEARELAGLFLLGEELIIHTSHEYKTAEESFRRMEYLIRNTPEFDRRTISIRTAAGELGFELDTGQRLRYLARSRSSGRGFTCNCLVLDEAMILDAGMMGATEPTLSTIPNAQIWYAGSAGIKGKSSQLASLRRRAADPDETKNLRLFFAEWSIDPHNEYCDPGCTEHDDPSTLESVAKANPALGIRISEEFINDERESMKDIPGEFEREVLSVGEYPSPDDAWLVVRELWWNNTEDAATDSPRLMHPIFAIDVNPERTRAVIAVCGLRTDGKVGIETVESRAGMSWLVDRAVEINDKHRPHRWIIDPVSEAGSFIDDLEKRGLRIEKITARDVTYASGMVFDGLRDGWLWHLGKETALRKALAGATKRDLAHSWAWDRKNSAVDISPLMAITTALWGYQKFGTSASYKIRSSVHFDTNEIIRLFRAGAYGYDDLARLESRGLLNEDDKDLLRAAGIGV